MSAPSIESVERFQASFHKQVVNERSHEVAEVVARVIGVDQQDTARPGQRSERGLDGSAYFIVVDHEHIIAAEGQGMKWVILGAVGGPALLGAIHLGANIVPVTIGEAVRWYVMMGAVSAALGGLITWAAPRGEESARNTVLWREIHRGLTNGILCGAIYSLLRLTLFLNSQELPLWFVTTYCAGVVALFTLGLGLFGVVIGTIKSRDAVL